MTETSQLVGPRVAVRLSRATLWFLFGVAAIVGIATLVRGTSQIITDLGSHSVDLTMVADKALPAAAKSASDSGATVVSGTFSTADITVTHVSGAVVAFSAIAEISLLLTQLALCLLVALLCWRLLRGHVFRHSVAVTVTLAGFVLAIGGLLSQIGIAFGSGLAASELNGSGRGYWPLAGRFDPTQMIFGFVLLLVGLAFEYGSRLAKDSEGLV